MKWLAWVLLLALAGCSAPAENEESQVDWDLLSGGEDPGDPAHLGPRETTDDEPMEAPLDGYLAMNPFDPELDNYTPHYHNDPFDAVSLSPERTVCSGPDQTGLIVEGNGTMGLGPNGEIRRPISFVNVTASNGAVLHRAVTDENGCAALPIMSGTWILRLEVANDGCGLSGPLIRADVTENPQYVRLQYSVPCA